MTNTVALIDTHPIMRKGLSVVLNNYCNEINILEASELDTFEELHSQQSPNVVILGINSNSKKKCIEMAGNLKKQFPKSMLIVYDENQFMNMYDPYFRLGINGYMLKQSNSSELVTCIKTVLDGKYFLCSTLIQLLFSNLFQETKTIVQQRRQLTEREKEIASYLSQGLGTSSIARTLNRKPSTISTIKNNVYKKLNVTNVLELRKAILANQS